MSLSPLGLVDLSPSLSSQSSHRVEEGQQRFLRFSLGQDLIGVLPLDRLQEVIRIRPEEILPLPALDPWILGVHSWRGDIVWVLDLGRLLGVSTLMEFVEIPQRLSALVIPSQKQRLGVVVQRVETIATYDLSTLQPLHPGMVPEGMVPYLKGYFIEPGGQMLLHLEAEGIGQALGAEASDSTPALPTESL